MLKVFVTDAVVSKGYDGAPALRFSEDGASVRFRIGESVYDKRAENNTRWINLSVKAFGQLCERIKKMQLKELSHVNIVGRLDEDIWTDPSTNEKKSVFVIIADEIEYASSTGGRSKEGQPTENPLGSPTPPTQANSGFTGYENFGDGFFGAEPGK